MSDFADMAVDEGIANWRGGGLMPFWPSDKQTGKPLHPLTTQRPIACRKCGYHFLFWHRAEGSWRLHHYALLPDEQTPRFVLHRCGYDSAGNKKNALAAQEPSS